MSATRTATLERPAAAAPSKAMAPEVSSSSSSSSSRLPSQMNPPFTLSTIKASIPAECFEKNVLVSLYYLVRDFAFLGLLYAAYPYINAAEGKYNPFGLTKLLWWNLVGFFGWCLFVVGHDCGHRTFASSVAVCDIFGLIAHTPLLVPFHGWRLSHKLHHMHHNDIDKDHSWVPVKETDYRVGFLEEGVDQTNKPVSFPSLVYSLTGTTLQYFWRFSHALLLLYPAYLIMDTEMTSGNHFNPYNKKLFTTAEERRGSFISTLCVVSWLSFLMHFVFQYDVLLFLDAYFVPYMIFTMWLSLVTYLHHTDPSLEYYSSNMASWSFLFGGLNTMDRSYGTVIDHLHHNIGTHMVHHLFFQAIPHYSLIKATEHAKTVLGQFYQFDSTSILQAYLHSQKNCKFIEDEGKVYKYHSDQDMSANWAPATKKAQ